MLSPAAATLKVAVAPRATLCATGWVVMLGGPNTVSVASELVTVPAELLTTTEYLLPLSASARAGVV